MTNYEMSDARFAELCADAQRLGTEAAENAAEWWAQDAIGGRAPSEATTVAALERLLQAIQDDGVDGGPNLSGEWAGDPTPASVLEELGVTEEELADTDATNDIIEAWEQGADTFANWCEAMVADALAHARDEEILARK